MAKWLGPAVLALLILRVLSVDVFGVVSNDSLSYLRRGEAPFVDGWILRGYRQVGYPIALWVIDHLRDLLWWDRIFAVAASQRLLLIVAVLTMWRTLRWWSLAILALASTPTVAVLTNFILTEGTTVPSALLFSGLLVWMIVTPGTSRLRLLVVAGSAGGVLVAMTLMKFQFAAYWPLLMASIAVAGSRGVLRRVHFIWLVGVPAALIGGVGLLQSLENDREVGVFEPVSEQARASWYGAYQAVFRAPDDVVITPQLEPFYGDGRLNDFLHGLEAEEPDYLVRRLVIEDRIDAMFAAADTDVETEQRRAIVGALLGGRTDDIQGLVNRALAVTPATLDSVYGANNLARNEGATVLLARVNEGRETAVLTSSAVVPPFSEWLADHRPIRGWITGASLVVTLGGLVLSGRLRWVAAASLLATAALAVALGLSYIDNGRYLVPGMLISLAMATVLLRDVVTEKGTRHTRTAEASVHP